MKNLFFVIVLGFILSSCENGSGNPPVDIETATNLKGVELVNTGDEYDVEQGIYHVHATLKLTGKETLRNIKVNAVYYDAVGHELATSKGDVDNELKPGEKDLVETSCLFPTSADMPTRVVLTAEETASR